MLQGVIRYVCSASLLVLLAACTTPLPSPVDPAVPALRAAAAVPAPAAVTPAPAAPADSPDEAPARPARPALLDGEPAREFQRGAASWYGPGFHGRRTASGEPFDMHALTAAHRSLPFGTLVRVHSLVNGRQVEVRITDRGPFSGHRIIDLSRAAAEALGMLGLGFKEVVLLVPTSTPEAAPPRPAPRAAKKPPRVSRRLPPRRP